MFFKPVENVELNQISLTGMRAIVLLGLLIEAPRSLQEIRETFISLNIMGQDNSDDILRIDLNTLKSMGCTITRADVKNGFKYHLIEHPFALRLTKEEVNVIKRAYKKIIHNADLELVVRFDELFKKIANSMNKSEEKETLYGLSILKEYDTKLISDLLEDCRKNKILRLIYENPSTHQQSEKNISAQKIVMQNDNVHLYCFDLDKDISMVLNVKRIKSVLSRMMGGNGIETETYNVKFFLKNFDFVQLEDNEQVLETLENGCVVEGHYYNDFIAAQRVLSFGADCKVLEPQKFKDKIVQKLVSMRSVYNAKGI